MAPHRRFRWRSRDDRRLREAWKRPVGADAAQGVHRVTIRPARADDGLSIRRLAVLDSAEVPSGALLVAEVSGELWAAVTVTGNLVIADPFRPTAELVRLLRLRAGQLHQAQERLSLNLNSRVRLSREGA